MLKYIITILIMSAVTAGLVCLGGCACNDAQAGAAIGAARRQRLILGADRHHPGCGGLFRSGLGAGCRGNAGHRTSTKTSGE